MKNWEVKKLGDVCSFFNGQAHEKVIDENGKYKLINSKFVSSEGEKFKRTNNALSPLFINDIVMVMSDVPNGKTLAKCYIVDKDDTYTLNQRICVIRSKSFDTRFLYYQLNRNKYLLSFNNGENQSNLRKDDILNCELFVPPLPEQQHIVSILDEAFAAITKAKANAEQNLKNSKELFESYLQGVFENPKDNWEKKKWGDLCHFVRGPFGGSLKKSIFKEEGYVVYEQKHAIHDHFNQLRYFIDEDKFNEMIRFELKAGDIIMSCSGVTLGRVAIVPEGIKRGIINQALLKLTPNKNVSVHFIKHWLRSRIFQKIIFDFAGGAAIPNVPSAKILKDILIPFPTLQEQEKVVNDIELMLVETQKLEAIYQQKINDLEELKKSVLQKAFSGELKTEKAIA
jgi:type I restriction enzyme S subunit